MLKASFIYASGVEKARPNNISFDLVLPISRLTLFNLLTNNVFLGFRIESTIQNQYQIHLQVSYLIKLIIDYFI